jgi:hypothetical protein
MGPAFAEMTNYMHQPGPRNRADLLDSPARRILADLASDEVLDGAFAWVCRRRRAWPADADIWSFRCDWRDERQRLKAALLSGRFRFGRLKRVVA